VSARLRILVGSGGKFAAPLLPYLQPIDGGTEGTMDLLVIILIVLVVLWLLGFTLHIGGGLIHILLVIAVIVLIIKLVRRV